MDNGQLIRQYEHGALSLAGNGEVFPIFERIAVHNEDKSQAIGRPIYDTQEQITIIIPGDPGNQPTRMVSDMDRVRFAEAYSRFKNEEAHVFDGTIVESWPILNTAQAAGLKHIGFYTVESIANCNDAHIGKLGLGGLMLRDKAIAFVEASKTGGVPERLVSENAQLRTQLEQMAQTVRDLKTSFESLAHKHHEPVAAINLEVDTAMSSARAVSANKRDLPVGWQDLKLREMIDMCRAFDFAVTPRNRDEAIKLLGEYQGQRDAVKK